MAKDRPLMVLTKKEGVRPENTLAKMYNKGNPKYYSNKGITPDQREQMDKYDRRSHRKYVLDKHPGSLIKRH